MKTFAAVDIGSNAIRVHISHLLKNKNVHEFKTVEYLRVPLRLGEDVFSTGEISSEKTWKLVLLGQSLVNLFELYEVDAYLACATSAMREAKNHPEVVAEITNKTGLNIEVIDGEREAQYTQLALLKHVKEGAWLHVDVGGGSTEINLYENGKMIASKSFKIGAVRILMKEDVSQEKKELHDWLTENTPKSRNSIRTLGTGGSIGKVYEMAKNPTDQPITFFKISEIKELIERHSIEDRINILKLSPDRADVIVPAIDIYLEIMKTVEATTMSVPKVGLSDGMFEVLFQEKILS